MGFKPGSFSKNFAWHGGGLSKLHNSIRKGFAGQIKSPTREAFRSLSGLGSALSLIPANFFLHNHNGKMSVDELVFQAIRRDHSASFDHLALFALHLNRAGQGSRINPRPAMWANQFVRRELWQNGAWQRSAISESRVASFLSEWIDATPKVKEKCKSNYRHIFELCGHLSGTLPIINSNSRQVSSPAIMLTWDRYILDGNIANRNSMQKLLFEEEIHKLVGTEYDEIHEISNKLFDFYVDAGMLERFGYGEKLKYTLSNFMVSQDIIDDEQEQADFVAQTEIDAATERQIRNVNSIKRNRINALRLKLHYSNRCQFCDTRLTIGTGEFYSEAAHIRALGDPHNGPDSLSNMLVLCPNHHLQFDMGIYRIKKRNKGYMILSRIDGDMLHNKKIEFKHKIDDNHIKYHFDWHSNKDDW